MVSKLQYRFMENIRQDNRDWDRWLREALMSVYPPPLKLLTCLYRLRQSMGKKQRALLRTLQYTKLWPLTIHWLRLMSDCGWITIKVAIS